MLLSIDIGNTTTALAVCHDQKVLDLYRIDNALKGADFRATVEKYLNRVIRKYSIAAVILCSVVPKIESRVSVIIRRALKIEPVIVGKDIKVPIINLYKNKSQVGQDRLVCAFAVKQLYGFPAIIIDLGTAITFDVITPLGHYDGGMIVPGIKMSTESLFAKTALLPNVKKISMPKRLVGKTTEESILSGIFYGYGSMCNGLIDQISKGFKKRPKVVVTGGHTQYMQKFIEKKITVTDPYLIFRGLAIIFQNMR